MSKKNRQSAPKLNFGFMLFGVVPGFDEERKRRWAMISERTDPRQDAVRLAPVTSKNHRSDKFVVYIPKGAAIDDSHQFDLDSWILLWWPRCYPATGCLREMTPVGTLPEPWLSRASSACVPRDILGK